MEPILNQLRELKLEAFAGNLETTVNEHPQAKAAILQTLETLCNAESAERHQRCVAYRIQEAHFGPIQTVDTFDFDYNPSTRKLKNRYLKLLEADLVAQALSVLFVGNSGLGKTHLARALGYYLCQKGQRVRYTTIGQMVLELTTAEATGMLKKVMNRYIKPTLLIVDEIGYVTLREPESNLVFQILSPRYDKRRPTVVTSNRPFGEWNQTFHNDAIAHAILDRLVERSEVFHLEGQSYRETHRKRLTS